MKYLSILKEAFACRKRLKNAKIGDLVVFCHHGVAVEILTEPPENRIKYILEEKAEKERAIRLHWFGPCPFVDELPAELVEANKAWAEANKKYAPEINALVKKYFPDCPWDGKTLPAEA